MDEILRKGAFAVTVVVSGIVAGYLVALGVQKRNEKAIGGKLMRVNYRFTKDFDD